MNTKHLILLGLLCLIISTGLHAAPADPVCASVKIEIQQELTLERQAFDARMKINNPLTDITLQNVTLTVNFKDESGQTAQATSDPDNNTAAFFIRTDTLDGIDTISGGSIAPHTAAIPTAGAAKNEPSGKLYFVGAKLTYTVN